MKKYKIYFASYPFNINEIPVENEIIISNNLDEAIKILENKYKNTVEVFEKLCKEVY
jgi:hypothetical protein